MEELNVKNVVFETKLDKFMDYSLKPNFKVAGPILGKNIKAFGGALAKVDPAEIVNKLETENQAVIDLNGEDFTINKELVEIKINAKEGFAVAMEDNVFTILDTTINQELVDEGLARELISKIQQLRKQNDFEMMDNIKIYVKADDEVKKAIDAHKEYILKETLAVELIEKEVSDEYDLNGHKTGIDVEKI